MVIESLKPDVVIPEVPLSEYVIPILRKRKEKVAVVYAPTGRQVTFGDVADETRRCACALHEFGIRKGDVVALCASNSIEYLIVLLAVTSIGGIVTTCNPGYTENELKRHFQHSKPKIVFCVPDNLKKNVFQINESGFTGAVRSMMDKKWSQAFPVVRIRPTEDIATLPYSSGTTGVPKGVMLTHFNVVASIILFRVDHMYLSDCRFSCLPLFHIAGMMNGLRCLVEGAKQVIDVRLDLKRLLSCVEQHKVTILTGVPPILLALDKSTILGNYDLSSLKTVSCRAAPLSSFVAKSISKKLGCSISQGYGLTEAVSLATNNPANSPFEAVGYLCANCKLKVVDIETGEELGANHNGELCFKSPTVMKGYYNNPEATARAFDSEGWFRSGDIGHYDENENVHIVDRLKDLIKYKAFQIAPAEVEAVILSHPKIADVAVVGVPDAEAGELAKAYVVKKDPTLTKSEINNLVESKLIKYKHLHGGIEFCSSIPKNPSGKILRRQLKKRNTESKL